MQIRLNLQSVSSGSAFIAVGMAASMCLLAQPGVMSIEVNDPRALAQAALQLERRVGIPLNYEDGPYLFSGDIVDVAPVIMTSEQRAAHPGAHVWVPRGGSLTVSLPIAPAGNVPASSVPGLVSWLITASRDKGLPGTYTISDTNGSIFIIPSSGRDTSGALVNIKPVLETRVNLPFEERSAGDALEAVLKQVSKASGAVVNVGAVPLNPMIATRLRFGATDEPARVVIARLLSGIGSITTGEGGTVPAFAYHLYFDPGQKMYFLNVHSVAGSSTSLPGLNPASSVSAPVATPGGNDPYTKRAVAPAP